jgi:hypothetical protein
VYPNNQNGIANIDLSGTPFAVADTFSVGGYEASRSATFSQNVQIVNLNGGGFAGWITPSPWMYNPFNAQGGFRLNLEYIVDCLRNNFLYSANISVHSSYFQKCLSEKTCQTVQ